ncbi:unannotated protein [freshwater metagenome]|uniref:Unannotated protein n=1 Tax=freshwater metagenome TaxID=449393 RepID=A0A6J6E7Z5_9ZZZZ
MNLDPPIGGSRRICRVHALGQDKADGVGRLGPGGMNNRRGHRNLLTLLISA